jgi:hypothetical protein
MLIVMLKGLLNFRGLGEFQHDIGMNDMLVPSEYRVKTSTNQAVKSEAGFGIDKGASA